MKKYTTYKDSGVEWIGEIPEHWKTVRVKYMLKDEGGIKIGPFGSALKLDTLTEEGIKIYGQSNVIKDDFGRGHKHLPVERFESDFTQYEILPGDVLVTMMGTTGKSKVFEPSFKRGILDSHLLRLRFKVKYFNSYLFVTVLQNGDYVYHQIKLNSKGSIMEGLNSTIVKELYVCKPPISEQPLILDYLDRKTTIIDSLIQQTKQRISLLQEQRKAIINQAVTKGLSHLPPSKGGTKGVPLKDSGVEWIGEVPEHWEITRIKRITKIIDCKHVTPTYIEEGIPVVSTGNVKPGKISLDNTRKISNDDFKNLTEGDRLPNKGDIIYSRNASVGAAAYIDKIEPFSMGQDVCLIRSSQNQEYLEMVLNSSIILDQLEQELVGSTFRRINIKQIKEFQIIVPPILQQDIITKRVKKKINDVKKLIKKEQNRIKLLKEYRQTLISEVVTGKIDVRES